MYKNLCLTAILCAVLHQGTAVLECYRCPKAVEPCKWADATKVSCGANVQPRQYPLCTLQRRKNDTSLALRGCAIEIDGRNYTCPETDLYEACKPCQEDLCNSALVPSISTKNYIIFAVLAFSLFYYMT